MTKSELDKQVADYSEHAIRVVKIGRCHLRDTAFLRHFCVDPLLLRHAYIVIMTEGQVDGRVVRTWWSFERGLDSINVAKGQREDIERLAYDGIARSEIGDFEDGDVKPGEQLTLGGLLGIVEKEVSLQYDFWRRNCKGFTGKLYNYCSLRQVADLDASDKFLFLGRWYINILTAFDELDSYRNMYVK